ncbi:hypothetical protein X880_3086 [Burkholderia pseudomallei MSHR4032]|nr:hypothetical protein X988_958 [Burkholderia pseudomallei TSV 48]KGU99519.1 hypothetical protein X880_3086 [Burkholderia pseudomallei MSHR4032]
MGAIVAGPGTRYRSRRAKNRRVGRRAKAGAGGGPRSRARRQFAAARVAGSDRGFGSSGSITGSGRRRPVRGDAATSASALRALVSPLFEMAWPAAANASATRRTTRRWARRSTRRRPRLRNRAARDSPAPGPAATRRRAGALATAPRRAPNTSAVRPTAKKPRGLRDNTAFPRFSRFRPLAPRRSPRAPPPSRAASPPGRSRLTVRTS